MRTLRVAVVGSGPAGLYTAEALIKQAAALDPAHQVKVDVLDRLCDEPRDVSHEAMQRLRVAGAVTHFSIIEQAFV